MTTLTKLQPLFSRQDNFNVVKRNIEHFIKYSTHHLLVPLQERSNRDFINFTYTGNQLFETFADRASYFIINKTSNTTYYHLARLQLSRPASYFKGLPLMVATGVLAFIETINSDQFNWLKITSPPAIKEYTSKVNSNIMRLDCNLAMILLEDQLAQNIKISRKLPERQTELASFLDSTTQEVALISNYPKALCKNNVFLYSHYWDQESFCDLDQYTTFNDNFIVPF